MDLQDNRGLVSFLAVMFISVLLMMITASFVQIMSRELRQATDNELSTMAYYAAEAGVEDALWDIRQEIENDGDMADIEQSDCQSDDWDFGQGNTGFSCRLITFAPNALEGGLGADESRQISFVGAGNDTIDLQWHSRDKGDYTSSTDFGNLPGGNTNPPADVWDSLPPIMRVEVISYPDSDDFVNDEIVQRVAFLRPREGTIVRNVDLGDMEPGDNMRDVNCDSDAEVYACHFQITGLNSVDEDNHIMRLKPFYNDTNYRIEALDDLDNPVAMPGNEAVIDVTGYANDVFRRVQARVPLGGVDTFGQDYVLLADEGVCKVMRVSRIENSANTNDGCELD